MSSAPWRPRWRQREGNEESGGRRGAEAHANSRGRGRWRGGRRGGRHASVERVRPNCFVGFRIVDPTIISKIEGLQQRVVEQLPETQSCMIDPRTLHVTLCVMRLPDEEAIEQAIAILRQQVEAVWLPTMGADPPRFEFRGLDFFSRNNVLFTPLDVSTAHAEKLATLAESLHNAFDAAGFATESFRKPFTPHLTIWKTSKDRDVIHQLNRQRRHDDPIQDALANYLYDSDPESFSAHVGTERPQSIELLSMGATEPDGYYKTHASASLVATSS